MKKYYRKIRFRGLTSVIGYTLFLLVFGVLLILESISEVMCFKECEQDLYDFNRTSIKKGELYNLDTDYILDCYATDSQGGYYILGIPDTTGEGVNFMGLYVPKDMMPLVDSICENFWSEEDAVSIERLKGVGKVTSMNANEVLYFHNWFRKYGVSTDSAFDFTLVLYSDNYPIKNTVGNFFFWLGLALCVFSIVLSVSGIKAGTGQVKRIFGEYNILEEDVVSDLDNGEVFENMIIGRKYLLILSDTSMLIPLDQIVWTYLNVTTTVHKFYYIIPIAKTKDTKLRIVLRNKSMYESKVRNGKHAEEILERIGQAAPYAIYGYSDELINACSTDFEGMVAEVDKRKLTAV